MPGERLVEADLVSALRVSRASVRAALTRLAHDGLVEKQPNRGARVRLIGEAEAIEITEARSVVEALACHYAAIRATDAELSELSAQLRLLDRLFADQDLLAYSDANSRLHTLILGASHHTTAQRLASALQGQTVRFQYRTILLPGRAQQSFGEHQAIVTSIIAHNPEAAETAMRTHLWNLAMRLSEKMGMRADVEPSLPEYALSEMLE